MKANESVRSATRVCVCDWGRYRVGKVEGRDCISRVVVVVVACIGNPLNSSMVECAQAVNYYRGEGLCGYAQMGEAATAAAMAT